MKPVSWSKKSASDSHQQLAPPIVRIQSSRRLECRQATEEDTCSVDHSFPVLFRCSPSPLSSTRNLPPRQEPEYTFHAGPRIVLTDVTVTDRKGNPVHGLRASDFQIFDNNKPQVLASFEEHTTTPVAPMEQTSASPGVYSNEFLQHLPPALNIIVVDITNLELPDQMYLYYELNQFIKNLSAGQPLAIYWQSGDSNLLLQRFTTDRNLLSAAVRKAIPRFPPPDRGSAYTESGYITLQTIEKDLGAISRPEKHSLVFRRILTLSALGSNGSPTGSANDLS